MRPSRILPDAGGYIASHPPEGCGRDLPSHPEGQQHVVRQEAQEPLEGFANRSLRMDARGGCVMKASEGGGYARV